MDRLNVFHAVLEMGAAFPGPSNGAVHRNLGLEVRSGIPEAFVQDHRNVATKGKLHIYSGFRSKHVWIAIELRMQQPRARTRDRTLSLKFKSKHSLRLTRCAERQFHSLGMRRQPGCELRLGEFAFCEFQHGGNHFRLARYDLKAIVKKKDVRREERRTLISVNEAVILAETCRISSSKVHKPRCFISEEMLGLSQRRLNTSHIPDALRAA